MSTIKILLVAVIAALSSNVVYAYDFEVDGIYYNILSEENKTCGVTRNANDYKGAINIPERVAYNNEEYIVTYICNYAFAHCSELTAISLPNTIDSIGDWAFDEAGISEITIPKFVKKIGLFCFDDCANLCTVCYNAINCKVNSSFACEKIKTVTVGAEVNVLPADIFMGCDSLKSIIFSEPSSLKSIEHSAFSGCDSLKHINLPNSLERIGDYAFRGCCFDELTIPESVNELRQMCFTKVRKLHYNLTNCKSLSNPFGCLSSDSVVIGTCVQIIPEYLFAYGHVKNVTFAEPSSLKSIKNNAFEFCVFEHIDLPNTLTEIGDMAFYCCDIGNITIPESVRSIGSLCFIPSDKDITISVIFNAVDCTTKSLGTFNDGYTSYLGEIKFGDKVKSIPEWLCYGAEKVTEIVIPASVESIGDYAFNGCNIENVTIPESVRSIGQFCFIPSDIAKTISVNFNAINCTTESLGPFWAGGQSRLGEIKFGDKVKTIPSGLCYGAERLTKINLPASVESIGTSAFSNCVGQTAVKFPQSLISIGSAAFSGCTGLKSELTIPKNVESVGMSAFSGCTGITTVTIESSETLLEAYAFSECTSIKSVNVFSTLPPIGTDDTFALITYRDATLNVPKTAKDAYTRQTCWRNFRHVEEKDFGGVDDVTADEGGICVNVRDGQVEVSGTDASEEVLVYDMSGIEIYRGTERTIALPTKGVYIVKVAGRTFKVAL